MSDPSEGLIISQRQHGFGSILTLYAAPYGIGIELHHCDPDGDPGGIWLNHEETAPDSVLPLA